MCDNLDNYPKKDNIYVNFLKKVKTENGLIKCKKCLENIGFVLLQRKDVFCRNCLYEYCSHKFRSTIGKSKLVKNNDRVLIAYSGGVNSSALIDMIKDGLNDSQHKRLRFIPSLLYIDESIINQESDEEKELTLKYVTNNMLNTDWICFISSIEMSYRLNDVNFYYELKNNEEFNRKWLSSVDNKFTDSLSSIKSLTSKQEFFKRMRYQIITDIAKKEKFDKVFFANNATNLSINLMSDVAIGKGIQLHSETGFIDSRYEIPILRPMREFTAKEIAFYAIVRDLKYTVNPTLVTNSVIKSSIQRLTETFVNELQKDFPSTVYTIFKTGNKLRYDNNTDEKMCIICNTSVDIIGRPECSAYEALRLTNMLSNNLNLNSERVENSELMSTQLCYSCNIIANEMTGIDEKFPKILRKKVDKKDIQEFLIGSNDDDL